MGRARVELEPLKNQRLRKWFPLSADSEGKKGSSNVRVQRRCCSFDFRRVDAVEAPSTRVTQVTGDLELVVQWRHNPALAFAPFRTR